MILIDTNIWLYAALRESPLHSVARTWLEATFNGDEPIALPGVWRWLCCGSAPIAG